MSANCSEYRGLTYFEAAHIAGLFVHPHTDCGPAHTHGRELFYDPTLPKTMQRSQFIGQIARRREGQGKGDLVTNLLALDEALAVVEPD